MPFRRHLTRAMIVALNEEYDRGGWWRALADDEDTLIALRNNYLNLYRNGCSIARIEHSGGKLVAKVHYKFLLKKKIAKPYITCASGSAIARNQDEILISSLNDISDIKYWTDVLGGLEKTGVHQVIRANSNVVDTEIALSGDESDEENAELPVSPFTATGKNSRIDFCAIQQEEHGELFLRFFEAKDYSYKAALFARPGLEPEVLNQLLKYQQMLEVHRTDILDAYRESIELAHALNGTNVLGKNISLSALGRPRLELDTKPRLVVFGFDEDQKNGRNFELRKKTLVDGLRKQGGADRLLLKGSPRDFVVGISKTSAGKSFSPSA